MTNLRFTTTALPFVGPGDSGGEIPGQEMLCKSFWVWELWDFSNC